MLQVCNQMQMIYSHFVFCCSGSTVLPVHFQADKEGHYECRILMKSGYDLRMIYLESTVSAKEKSIQIEFNTQAIRPLTQNIPMVRKCFSALCCDLH